MLYFMCIINHWLLLVHISRAFARCLFETITQSSLDCHLRFQLGDDELQQCVFALLFDDLRPNQSRLRIVRYWPYKVVDWFSSFQSLLFFINTQACSFHVYSFHFLDDRRQFIVESKAVP